MSNATSSRDGALMQETGQQIRANVHTCVDRDALYTIWRMYWWRLLLGLRLPFPSTAYSVLGSPELVLGAAALPEPSFKIPGPRSRSQGQIFASGDPTGLPLGPAHLGFTCELLAQQTILVAGRLAPGPHFKFLSTTQPELGMHSPAPGADSLLGLLINFLVPSGYLLGLLIFLLDPLANIPEPSPRQLHRLVARMLLQIHSYQAFAINV
jgi:hypothetical protein